MMTSLCCEEAEFCDGCGAALCPEHGVAGIHGECALCHETCRSPECDPLALDRLEDA